MHAHAIKLTHISERMSILGIDLGLWCNALRDASYLFLSMYFSSFTLKKNGLTDFNPVSNDALCSRLYLDYGIQKNTENLLQLI